MSETIEPINKHELAIVSSRWQDALEEMRNARWPEQTLAEWLEHAQTALKELEADRKELTGPLDRQMKATNKVFREAMQPLEDFKVLAKDKLAALALERDNVARAAREALAANAAPEAVQAAITTLMAEPVKAEGLRTSYGWRAIVVDANLVPREYLTVDTEKLERVARVHAKDDYLEEIPGVRWERFSTVSSSGRRK